MIYGVKEVPNIIVKYKKDGAKNYKKIVFDCLKDYHASFGGADNTLYFSNTMLTEEFENFRTELVNDSVHDFVISATNFRRWENGEDEEYTELKDVKFDTCKLKYAFFADGDIASFTLLFYNREDNE